MSSSTTQHNSSTNANIFGGPRASVHSTVFSISNNKIHCVRVDVRQYYLDHKLKCIWPHICAIARASITITVLFFRQCRSSASIVSLFVRSRSNEEHSLCAHTILFIYRFFLLLVLDFFFLLSCVWMWMRLRTRTDCVKLYLRLLQLVCVSLILFVEKNKWQRPMIEPNSRCKISCLAREYLMSNGHM